MEDVEKFVIDEETGLRVSNLGRVIGKRGKEIYGGVTKCGYRQVLWYDTSGKHRYVKVHNLVARNFLKNENNLPQVNHIDENKFNNRVDNLEWCSARYNSSYGTRTKRMIETRIKNGGTIPCVLVKGYIVLRANSLSEMSRKTGMSFGGVRDIVNRKRTHNFGWHLPDVIPSNRSSEKRAVTISKCGEIKTFPSVRDAANFIGRNCRGVRAALSGEQNTCAGWKVALAS